MTRRNWKKVNPRSLREALELAKDHAKEAHNRSVERLAELMGEESHWTVYGWLRDDFSIIFGQFISYYIYIWNLNIKGVWPRLPRVVRAAIIMLPIAALAMMLSDVPAFVNTFFHNEKVPLWLLVFGSAGQFIFTIRFIYQWYYSYRRHASILPVGFWIISLVGSGIIVAYACFRLDPVLIIGQSVGFITYSRNIVLCLRR